MRRFALLASLISACSSGMDFDSLRQPIVGGTIDTGDPAVVLLIAQIGNTGQAGLCTASIISPRVILTAAHCVDPDVVDPNHRGITFMVFLGNNINDQSQHSYGNFVDVQDTQWDEQFNDNFLENGHDIAVVITKTALAIPPLQINRQALQPSDKNATLRVVGYGVTSGSSEDSGTKRQMSTPLVDFDSKFVLFGTNQKNTCEGDSGGPAFITRNGVEYIVGVTSFGYEGCVDTGSDTRVDSYLSFIDPFLNQYPPASPDMAQPRDGGVKGDGAAGPQPGETGASCQQHSDCNSRVCVSEGGGGYCTELCDPEADACPENMKCGNIDDTDYCVQDDGGGGCAVSSSAAAPWAPLAVFIVGLVVAWQRRRRA